MNLATMSAVPETLDEGLCAACAHAPDCTHARLSGPPVVSCDDAAPLRLRIAPATGVATRPAIAPPPPSAVKGLCATCARFDDCTYPKPESGVWRCEEFE